MIMYEIGNGCAERNKNHLSRQGNAETMAGVRLVSLDSPTNEHHLKTFHADGVRLHLQAAILAKHVATNSVASYFGNTIVDIVS